jgi:hypothetical protein
MLETISISVSAAAIFSALDGCGFRPKKDMAVMSKRRGVGAVQWGWGCSWSGCWRCCCGWIAAKQDVKLSRPKFAELGCTARIFAEGLMLARLELDACGYRGLVVPTKAFDRNERARLNKRCSARLSQSKDDRRISNGDAWDAHSPPQPFSICADALLQRQESVAVMSSQ